MRGDGREGGEGHVGAVGGGGHAGARGLQRQLVAAAVEIGGLGGRQRGGRVVHRAQRQRVRAGCRALGHAAYRGWVAVRGPAALRRRPRQRLHFVHHFVVVVAFGRGRREVLGWGGRGGRVVEAGRERRPRFVVERLSGVFLQRRGDAQAS